MCWSATCASVAPTTTATPADLAILILAACLSLILAPACEPASPPELATLESLSPREIEPGEELTLSGTGFVVGRAELVLEGTLTAPGRARSRSGTERLVLSVLATSPTTASARLGRRHFDGLEAAHTTFIGSATLRFPSAAGEDAPPITAALDDVRLELFAGPATHSTEARRARERGEAALAELGLDTMTLSEGRGLLVMGVSPGSAADRAGLRSGDVIVSCGALTVASPGDLAPPPRTRRLTLGLRDADGGFRRAAPRLQRPGAAPETERIAALAIAGCALILLLVAAGPLFSPFCWLRAGIAGGAGGPRDVLGGLTAASRANPAATALALLLFAAAPFLIMALAEAGVVVGSGLVLLASVFEAVSSSRGWRRLAALWTGLFRALPLLLACVVSAARAASVDLRVVSLAQGAAPWEWTALADPACLLLLVLVISVSLAGTDRSVGPVAALQRGLVGGLAAAVLLGGWNLSSEGELLGQVLFAGKSWVVGLSLAAAGRSRSLLVLPLAAAAAAGALALAILPLPDWIGTAAAWSAGAAACFWVLPWWAGLAVRAPRCSPRARPAAGRVEPDPGVSADLAISRSPLPHPGH